MEGTIQLLDGSFADVSEIIPKLDDDNFYYGDLGKLALSSSACKLLLESPKKYKYVTLYGQSDAKPLILGRLMHLFLLEPKRIEEECIFVDVASRAAKAFKLAKEEAAGRMVFTRTEKEASEKVTDALLQNEEVQKMLKGVKTEVGIVGEVMGLPFRAKADIMAENHIIDFKTTTNIKTFQYSADKYGYDLQAYLYCELFGVDKFTFLVVDKDTLDIGIFETTEDFLQRGKAKLINAVEVYNDWFKGNDLEDVDVSNYVLRGIL